MTSRRSPDFWRQFELQVAEMMRLDELRGALDCERRRGSGHMLGAAVNLFPSGVRLVLAGRDVDASHYFDAVRTMALEGVSAGETYVYQGPFADLFAKYMGFKLAGLSEAALEGNRSCELKVEAHAFLRQLTETLPRPRPTEVLARMCIDASERCDWILSSRLEREIDLNSRWAPLCISLIALAKERSFQPRDLAQCGALKKTFQEMTDVGLQGAPYPSWMGADDAASVAQVLGEHCYGVKEFRANLRAMRWGW